MDDTEQTFLLPDLGEGLTEAEIVRWLVQEGDDIVVDQPIAEVETAKSIVEVPSPYAGRIRTRHGREGETVQVGSPLLSVARGGGEPAEPPAAQAYREEEQAGSGNVLIGYGTSGHATTGRRRRARPPAKDDSGIEVAAESRAAPRVVSPLVRRLAAENDVDLTAVPGSGPRGLITKADIVRFLETAESAPAAQPALSADPGATRIPLSGFRKAVSEALTRSRSEIPEATVWVDVDATALWQLRESTKQANPDSPGLLAYLARFTVAALKQYPVLNARVDTVREEIVQLDRINLGIAVQGERGLVVPAVLGADGLTTTQLDEQIRSVTADARVGRCSHEVLTAGTFTLNNYGSFRVDGSAAIINHPQVAILGFGRILERPWVVDGSIVPRRITQLSFAFDHRVCDGGTAAGFMRCVADAIEDPLAAIAGL
nr:dihydrolipoamide acetyltransferase family protein [Branchiibius hedensis]